MWQTILFYFSLWWSDQFTWNDFELTKKARQEYPQTKAQLASERESYFKRYQKANQKQKKLIIVEARQYLEESLLTKIFPAWYGTLWSFEGYSDRPGYGTIACGHFVATTLSHLGLNFNRVRMGQLDSPYLIKSFVPKAKTFKSYDWPIEKFLSKASDLGDGIFIVGMDNHAGLLAIQGGNHLFIHSGSMAYLSAAHAEPPGDRSQLAISRWRMAGKLFSDQMVVKWIKKARFKRASKN
jgi:hypothetical protein